MSLNSYLNFLTAKVECCFHC